MGNTLIRRVDPQNMNNLAEVPNEIFVKICSFLDHEDLLRLAQCSHSTHERVGYFLTSHVTEEDFTRWIHFRENKAEDRIISYNDDEERLEMYSCGETMLKHSSRKLQDEDHFNKHISLFLRFGFRKCIDQSK